MVQLRLVDSLEPILGSIQPPLRMLQPQGPFSGYGVHISRIILLPRVSFKPLVSCLDRRRTIWAEDPVIAEAVSRDPGDDYLVALAQAANVDHPVSGGQDLTSLAATVSPPVLPPTVFLDLPGPLPPA